MKTYDLTSSANPFGPSKKVRNALRKAIKKVNKGDEKERRLLKKYIAMKEGIKEDEVLFFSSLPLFLNFFCEAYSVSSIWVVLPLSRRLRGYLDAVKRLYGERLRIRPLEITSPTSVDTNPEDLFFITYPHDVLGLSANPHIERILRYAKDKGIKVIVDETLQEFSGTPTKLPEILRIDDSFLLRNLSDIYGLGGLPFFCAFAKASTIERMEPYLSLDEIPYLTYNAIRVAMKDKRFKERKRVLLNEEKAYVMEKAKKLKELLVEDGGCNFVLLKSPYFSGDVEKILRRRGFITEVFTGEKGESYLRFPLKKRKVNAQFIKTVAALIEELKNQ